MKLSVSAKVNLPFAIGIVLMFGVSIVALRSISSLVESAHWVAHSQQVLAKLGVVLTLTDDIETGSRGYVITGADRFLEPYRAALVKIHQEVKALRELTADNATQQLRVNILEPLIERKLAMAGDRISLRKEKGFAAVRQLILTDQGKQVMDEIRSVIRKMVEEEDSFLKQKEEEESRNARLAFWIIACGAGLSLAVTVFALLIINLDVAIQDKLEAEKLTLETLIQKRVKDTKLPLR
jgi:CHASE3 domain sensor protein